MPHIYIYLKVRAGRLDIASLQGPREGGERVWFPLFAHVLYHTPMALRPLHLTELPKLATSPELQEVNCFLDLMPKPIPIDTPLPRVHALLLYLYNVMCPSSPTQSPTNGQLVLLLLHAFIVCLKYSTYLYVLVSSLIALVISFQ